MNPTPFSPDRNNNGAPPPDAPVSLIFLVGPRAVGKSTLGPNLAKRLGWSFADTDDHIAARTGVDTPALVAREGWDAFRRHEALALREAARPFFVIATGGGMVLKEENRAFMRQKGLVIYLHAPAEVLGERLLGQGQSEARPSLTGRHPAEEIRDVLAQREPLYRDAAHVVVRAEAPAGDVLETLVQAVRSAGVAAPARGT